MKKKKSFSKQINRAKAFIKKVWEILNRPEMAILPGQLAFFLILSLVPIITIIGYGASFFNISIDTIIEFLKANFDQSIVKLIVPIISGKSLDFNYICMIIIMLYFASNSADSIIITANEIYGIKQSTWLKRRIKAIGLTFLIIVLYLFVLIVPLLGEKIVDAFDYFNLKNIITSILKIIQGPISWLIIFAFIKTIFTIAPDKHIPASQINFGAIFTTVGWILTTEIYGYYTSHFARYDIFYAGLSNIAVLMLWIYFLSFIFVIGLSLTTRIEKEELEKTGSINIEE